MRGSYAHCLLAAALVQSAAAYKYFNKKQSFSN
jgi:hypothetical protein